MCDATTKHRIQQSHATSEPLCAALCCMLIREYIYIYYYVDGSITTSMPSHRYDTVSIILQQTTDAHREQQQQQITAMTTGVLYLE
jgi:hypothetical protein